MSRVEDLLESVVTPPRRSARTRKPVVKYGEVLENENEMDREGTQEDFLNSKRKRKSTSSRGEMESQVSEFSEDDQDGKVSDNEDPWKSTAPKQATRAKKQKRSTRKSTEQSSVQLNPAEPVSKLVDDLRNGSTSVTSIVNEWISGAISKDEKLNDSSARILIDGCLQTAIYNGSIFVKEEEYKNSDPSSVVSKLVDSAVNIATETYPLLAKDKISKKLSTRFAEFWKRVILSLPEAILYGEGEMENLFEWLLALSKSKRQSFRHTGMVALYSIMDALIEISLNKESQLDVINRRINTEENKKAKSKSNPKLKQFLSDQKDLNTHIASLERNISMIFEQVFVSRFRDVHSAIRNTSIEILGSWMKSFPYFVHVNYLKYLGWGLSDSDSSVRCSALNSVKEVFLRWGAEEPLVLFHQRFVNRILEMTRDVDSSVVTASVDLITQLMKNPDLQFDEEKLDQIPKMLWDMSASVRKAVANHIYETAFVREDDEKDGALQLSINDLKNLISLFAECAPLQEGCTSENIDVAIQIYVDSLSSVIPCFRCWEAYFEILTPADSQNSNYLSDLDLNNTFLGEPETILLRFLVSSIKKLDDELKSLQNLKSAKHKKDVLTNLRDGVQLELAGKLFSLLSSFQADDEQLLCVLHLLKLVDSNEISTNFQSEIGQLSNLLKKLFLVREDEQMLSNLADVIMKLREVYQEPIDQILSDISEKFLQSLNLLLTNPRANLKPQALKSNSILFQRIFVMISKFKFPEIIGSFDNFVDALQLLASTNAKDKEAIFYSTSRCLQILYSILLWEISDVDRSNPECIAAIEPRLLVFFKLCEELLLNEDLSFGIHPFRVCGDFFLISDANELGLKGLIPPTLWDGFYQFFMRCIQNISESGEEAEVIELFLPASKAVLASTEINQRLAAEIVSNYNMFGSSVDSLIRQLMSKLKSWDSNALLSIQLQALQILWNNRREDLREVSSKFVLSFGLDRGFSFMQLIRDGINFSVQRGLDNLDFLNQALVPYIMRSSVDDVKSSVDYLKLKLQTEELSHHDQEIMLKFEEVCAKRISRPSKTHQTSVHLNSDLNSEEFRSDILESESNMMPSALSDMLSEDHDVSEN